jgi:hypothetical protein
MAADLAARVCLGERLAVAQVLKLIDARKPEDRARTPPLLRELGDSSGGEDAIRIALTGAPGAGKSTLADAPIGEIRAREQTVGVGQSEAGVADPGDMLIYVAQPGAGDVSGRRALCAGSKQTRKLTHVVEQVLEDPHCWLDSHGNRYDKPGQVTQMFASPLRSKSGESKPCSAWPAKL